MANLHILQIIEALRGSDEYIVPIFTEGSCYKFHLFLKKLFPNCKPWISIEKHMSHVITELDGHFYDIRGEVDPVRAEKLFKPLINPLSIKRCEK